MEKPKEETETPKKEEDKKIAVPCPTCNLKRLQLLYFEEDLEKVETNLSFTCLDCGQYIVIKLGGFAQEELSAEKQQPVSRLSYI
jgi:ribosomal protein S27E